MCCSDAPIHGVGALQKKQTDLPGHPGWRCIGSAAKIDFELASPQRLHVNYNLNFAPEQLV